MIATSATLLLKLSDVANELAVEPIAVRRIVARGRIKATPLTDPDNLRFTREALAAYVQAGAPDLKMPAVDDRWFVGPDRTVADVRFRGEVQAAAEDQRMSDAALLAAVAASGREVSVELRPSEAIQAVFARQTEKPLFRLAGEWKPEFPLLSDGFFVYKLRTAARDAVNDAAKPMDNRLVTFFASPTAYRAFVDAAIADVFADSIRFREVRNLGGANGNATVTYRLALGFWATRPKLTSLVDQIAF